MPFCLEFFSLSFAQENLESLKRQLEEQKRLIEELQKKIEALEKAQEKQKPAVESQQEAQKPTPADRTLQLRLKYDDRLRAYQVSPFRQTAFLPDISFILDASLVGRNRNDQEFKKLEIPGLYHSHAHEGHGHGALNEKRGFNLNYGELYLYAPVDPYFDLFVNHSFF